MDAHLSLTRREFGKSIFAAMASKLFGPFEIIDAGQQYGHEAMTTYYIDNTASGAGTPGDIGAPYEAVANLPTLLGGDIVLFRHDQTHAFAAVLTPGTGKGITVDRYAPTGEATSIPNLDGGSVRQAVLDFNAVTTPISISNVNIQNLAVGTIWAGIRVQGVCTAAITLTNVSTSGAMPSSSVQFRNATLGAAVTIDGLASETSGTQSAGLYFNVCVINAPVIVRNSTFTDSGDNSTDLQLRGCHILTMSGTGYIEFLGNTFTSMNRGILINVATDVRIGDGTEAGRNIFDSCWDGDTYPDGSGQGVLIEGSGVTTNVVVNKNTMVDCNRGIVNSSTNVGSDDIWFIGNKVIGSKVSGIDWKGYGVGGIIAHNDIRHSPQEDGHGIVVQQAGAATEVAIKNNAIFMATPTTYPGDTTNVQCISIANSRAEVDLDNNAYSIIANAAGDSAPVAALDTVNYATAWAWKNALAGDATVIGDDVNSLFGLAFTVDATTPYELKNGQELLEAGVSITGVNDAGQFGDTPNIGASINLYAHHTAANWNEAALTTTHAQNVVTRHA